MGYLFGDSGIREIITKLRHFDMDGKLMLPKKLKEDLKENGLKWKS